MGPTIDQQLVRYLFDACARAAEDSSLGALRTKHGGGRMPCGWAFVAQQTHGKRGRVKDADALGMKIGQEIGEGGVVKAVMAVALDLIYRDSIDDVLEDAHRKAGYANEARLAGGLHLPQSGYCFVDNLVEVAELHVVNLNEVHVVHAEAGEAVIDTAGNAGGRKIEVYDIGTVASDLGGEHVAIAADALEGFAEDRLCLGGSVVGGGVDEVDAVIEGDVYRADTFGLVDFSVG